MSRIDSSSPAMTVHRHLQAASATQSSALGRLSSGLRINRAADDAAGLSVAESLRAVASGSRVAIRNAQDGIGVMQVAEGALAEVHAMLHRMAELATAAANAGANDLAGREAGQAEFTQLVAEIDRIASTTAYGSTTLIDGSYGLALGKVEGLVAGETVTVHQGDSFKLTVRFPLMGDALLSERTINLDAGNYSAAQFAAMVQSKVRTATAASSADYEQELGYGFGVRAVALDWGYELQLENHSGAFSMTFEDVTGDVMARVGLDDAVLPTSDGAARVSNDQNIGMFHLGATGSMYNKVVVEAHDFRTTSGTAAVMTSLASADITTLDGAQAAMDAVSAAVQDVSAARAQFGSLQNRFEHVISSLQVTRESLMASESGIRDADMAEELVAFTRSQILTRAGTAMLAQANQSAQSALALLR